jgi:hypothetical protein
MNNAEKQSLDLSLDLAKIGFKALLGPEFEGLKLGVELMVSVFKAATGVSDDSGLKTLEQLQKIWDDANKVLDEAKSSLNNSTLTLGVDQQTRVQLVRDNKNIEDSKNLQEISTYANKYHVAIDDILKTNLTESQRIKLVKERLKALEGTLQQRIDMDQRQKDLAELQQKNAQYTVDQAATPLNISKSQDAVRKLPDLVAKLGTIISTLQTKIKEKAEEIKAQSKTDSQQTTVPEPNTDTPPAGLSQVLNLVAVALGKVADALQVSIVEKPQDTGANGGKPEEPNKPPDPPRTWKTAIRDSIAEMGDWSKNMEDIAKKTAQSMQSTMGSIFFDAVNGKLKSLSDYATSFLNSILQSVTSAMANMFTSYLLNKIPGLATGGPVNAGSTYIVGEKGPEIFVPSSSGTIIPNHKLNSVAAAATAPQVTVNVINKPGQPAASGQESSFNGQSYVVSAWLDALNRNVGGMRDIIRAGSR